MSDFEFNSVVISILIAFALSEVLASWGSLIKHSPKRGSWLYVVSSLLLVRLLVGHWLGLATYRALPTITPAESLLIFSPSFAAALASFILSPDRTERSLDLEAHYFAVSRWVYPLLASFALFAGLSDLLVPMEAPLPLSFYLCWAGALLIPGLTANRSAHWVVLAASFLAPALAFTLL